MLDKFDNASFDCIIKFLSIEDYIFIILTSKAIRGKAIIYKQIKTPFICVIKWSHTYEHYKRIKSVYHLSKECKTELRNIDYNILNDKRLYCNQDLIKIIIKLGKKCFRDDDETIFLFAVPWKFREGFKSKKRGKLDVGKYVNAKLEKYGKKINDMNNNDSKKEMESLLFQKLLRKREILEQYLKIDNVYMKAFNNRLDTILYNEV